MKEIEVKDIAMWEETDSELAKYKIQALNGLVNSYKKQNEFFKASIKHIEQVNKVLYKRIDKAIEYIEDKKSYEEICEDKYKGNGTYYEDVIREKDINYLLDILRGKDNE